VQKLLGTLRATVLLLGVWGALLLTAYLTDVLPSFPWQGEPEPAPASAPTPPVASADAGVAVVTRVPSTSAPDAGAAPSATAAAPEPAEAAAAAAPGTQRYEACPPDALLREPTLVAVPVLGQGIQLVLGCGDTTHLLAVTEGPTGLRPMRVARFTWEAPSLRGERHGAMAAAADVNADGLLDLVLGQLATATRSAAQQGALYYVARDARGGFDAPAALAPIAVASIALADLDDRDGVDILALHQADTFGRRPSEAWVFSGGGAPSRTSRLDAGATARVVRAVDLDRDGNLDVVTLGDGDPGGRIHFGDGNGRFPRNQALVLAGAREAEVGDLDADGAPDLVVTGDALRIVRARADAGALVAEPITTPAPISSLTVIDANADGLLDLVGLVGGGIGLLAQTEARTFDARPFADLPLDAGTLVAVAVADLGGADALDVAVLVKRPGEENGHELVLVTDITEPIVATTSAEVAPIPDAPLTLGVEMR
jgi:hypothetical protein